MSRAKVRKSCNILNIKYLFIHGPDSLKQIGAVSAHLVAIIAPDTGLEETGANNEPASAAFAPLFKGRNRCKKILIH